MWHLFNNCFLTRVVFINYKNSFPTRVYSREYKFSFFLFLSFFAAWFDWKFAWLSLVPFFIQVLLKCRLKEFVSILRNIIPTASRTIKFLIQSKTLIFISSYFSLNNSLLQYPMRNLFHFKLRCLSYTNIIVS